MASDYRINIIVRAIAMQGGKGHACSVEFKAHNVAEFQAYPPEWRDWLSRGFFQYTPTYKAYPSGQRAYSSARGIVRRLMKKYGLKPSDVIVQEIGPGGMRAPFRYT
jgi:ABC-type nitrate/sulfonate/bicarbonate transport system substrate-binding protein